MNFRTLDLNLLRVFDAVMSTGSLTRAAEMLAITQPAVSHALKRLHQAVGEGLFVRNAFGMSPSPRAQALWPQVRVALSTLQQALAPEAYDPSSQAASFRLAMTDATAVLLMPALVAEIQRSAALANLRVLPLATHDPSRLLELGTADLAVGHFPETVTALLAGGAEAPLRHARLYDTRYVCAMRRGHPLAEGRLTLDAYCAAPHLLASASGQAQGRVDQALAAIGRQRRIVLTVNQFFTAGRVVAQSDLLTVLPRCFLPATGCQGELVVRELPFDLAPVQVTMLWHLRRDGDPAHAWLRRQVLQAATAEASAAAAIAPRPAPPPSGGARTRTPPA
jgi:DNA-binding transcriptional LysR family regulator